MRKISILPGQIIGEGPLLFAVAVKGTQDWDGTAIWLVAAPSIPVAQETVAAQYDRTDFDDCADWTFEHIGDFV